ncbi:MAG: DNA repair protein RadA [Leptospira sp.]|nr:DNA repair protein RadA [Leptospira sp.]
MKKPSRNFVCSACGENFSRWAGKCEACGEWNTITEENSSSRFEQKALPRNGLVRYAKPIAIAEIEEESGGRLTTGLGELDIVLGGGIVPGSLILIGGEPGVGKSTLILEIARNISKEKKVLYISGEESASQISIRAKRMKINSPNVLLSSEIYVENISDMIGQEKPQIVFIDSIQTINRESLLNQAGSVTQLRQCTQVLLEAAKKTNIPVFLIGHITKDGNIAGPKLLEHLVDTVLYFEGDKLNYYRHLRAVKNRYGAVGTLAVFEMHSEGLREVKDRHNLFITPGQETRNGSALSVVMEGVRALSVEVQALVTRSSFSQSRRMSEGLDTRRLILMAAVLEKFMGLKMTECDIFSNLAGGLSVDEPALDLAICATVISSYLEKPIRGGLALFGEVGLSGEVRSVGQISLRLKELEGIGIKTVILPDGNLKEIGKERYAIELIGIRHIREIERVF